MQGVFPSAFAISPLQVYRYYSFNITSSTSHVTTPNTSTPYRPLRSSRLQTLQTPFNTLHALHLFPAPTSPLEHDGSGSMIGTHTHIRYIAIDLL
jgi:hypothetical protein